MVILQRHILSRLLLYFGIILESILLKYYTLFYLWLTGIFANIANIGNAANRDPRQWEGIQERAQIYIRAKTDLFLEIEIRGVKEFTFCDRDDDDENICFAKT